MSVNLCQFHLKLCKLCIWDRRKDCGLTRRFQETYSKYLTTITCRNSSKNYYTDDISVQELVYLIMFHNLVPKLQKKRAICNSKTKQKMATIFLAVSFCLIGKKDVYLTSFDITLYIGGCSLFCWGFETHWWTRLPYNTWSHSTCTLHKCYSPGQWILYKTIDYMTT